MGTLMFTKRVFGFWLLIITGIMLQAIGKEEDPDGYGFGVIGASWF
jgi:hypothetical protein